VIPLVIIPARGDSKGIPGKNIKILGGKPLIHYTIEAARKVFKDENIYVSTDSLKIKSVTEETGLIVPFLRPKYLATDTANSRDVILHALEYFNLKNKKLPDLIILLQPTSPFRNQTHISEALELYDKSIDMVVSVKETTSNPYYSLFEEDSNNFLKKSKESTATRRQDTPKVYEFNGAIYIINPESLKSKSFNQFNRVKKYLMDEYNSIDIDRNIDIIIAETILDSKLVK
jgi:CMP-N,N'-diacetyllegionaminic acid synthase